MKDYWRGAEQVSRGSVYKGAVCMTEVRDALHNHALEDEGPNRIGNSSGWHRTRLDKGESKKDQNLSAIISAIGIIVSFLLGATSLLMQILRFGAKP
jgi:hypothetical protein